MFILFPQFTITPNSKLPKQGYWLRKSYDSRIGFHYVPLNKKGLAANVIIFVLVVGYFACLIFSPLIRNYFNDNKLVAVFVFLSTLLIPRLLLWGKVSGD